MTTNYEPIVLKLENKKDIFDTDKDTNFSYNIDYPKFSLGFQHFIHQSKDKMQIV